MTLPSGLGVFSVMAAPSCCLVAFSHLQFSQIRGRQPYLFVRKILYVILQPLQAHDRRVSVVAIRDGPARSGRLTDDPHPKIPDVTAAWLLSSIDIDGRSGFFSSGACGA